MVARTRTDRGLVVIFNHPNGEYELAYVIDSLAAAARAVTMIADRKQLEAGDSIVVREADADETLPQASRASHYS